MRVNPIMQQRRKLWPPKACSFKAYLHAAGMVQSRAFHLQQDNWVTGESIEGALLLLRSAPRHAPPCRHAHRRSAWPPAVQILHMGEPHAACFFTRLWSKNLAD
jgi:hypothetical protein